MIILEPLLMSILTKNSGLTFKRRFWLLGMEYSIAELFRGYFSTIFPLPGATILAAHTFAFYVVRKYANEEFDLLAKPLKTAILVHAVFEVIVVAGLTLAFHERSSSDGVDE